MNSLLTGEFLAQVKNTCAMKEFSTMRLLLKIHNSDFSLIFLI